MTVWVGLRYGERGRVDVLKIYQAHTSIDKMNVKNILCLNYVTSSVFHFGIGSNLRKVWQELIFASCGKEYIIL
uniref:Uncharacterized protein n=1 Tax=Octopus bimaculoides TaxID=37653 RepID=A0A0L8G1S5_OCTBM